MKKDRLKKLAFLLENENNTELNFSMESFRSLSNNKVFACVAGWTCYMELGMEEFCKLSLAEIRPKAKRLLGLSQIQTKELFLPNKDFQYQVSKKDVANVIRSLIKTGKVVWPNP